MGRYFNKPVFWGKSNNAPLSQDNAVRRECITHKGRAKQAVSYGLTDDRKAMYVGFQTPKGDVGCQYYGKQAVASLGAKMLNWSKEMIGDDAEECEGKGTTISAMGSS